MEKHIRSMHYYSITFPVAENIRDGIGLWFGMARGVLGMGIANAAFEFSFIMYCSYFPPDFEYG